jgi:hypothetical protein
MMSTKRQRALGFALALGSLTWAVSANAETAPQKWLIAPPVEYDHPYAGKLTVRLAKDQAEVRAWCPGAKWKTNVMLACAFPGPEFCTIVMASAEVLWEQGFTPEIILRHETAHCNGWPADHKGARVWQKIGPSLRSN